MTARQRIWITDAYFVAPRSLSEALGSAARDGVDVRILVPAHNNWPIVGSISRGGYRALLEAGVRIFEWQGPMIHAKTSVVDGVWSTIGSLNVVRNRTVTRASKVGARGNPMTGTTHSARTIRSSMRRSIPTA